MPVYNYRCTQCGADYDIVRNISQSEFPPQPDERRCQCDASQLKQITAPAGFIRGDKWGIGRKGEWGR